MPDWALAIVALLVLNGLFVAAGYRQQTVMRRRHATHTPPAAPEEGNR